MITDHGKIWINRSFEADIRENNGTWEFRPYYNSSPRDTTGIEMNAMIRDMGRIWTEVPEGEIPAVKKTLRITE